MINNIKLFELYLNYGYARVLQYTYLDMQLMIRLIYIVY